MLQGGLRTPEHGAYIRERETQAHSHTHMHNQDNTRQESFPGKNPFRRDFIIIIIIIINSMLDKNPFHEIIGVTKKNKIKNKK